MTGVQTCALPICFDPLHWLAELDTRRVRQLHIVGYSEREGRLMDDHAAAVQPELLELARSVVARAPVEAIILERDAAFPAFDAMDAEIASSSESMDEIDFHTALARLLSDVALREQFAQAPAAVAEKLRVRSAERDDFAALSAQEVEVQALILLRKRFDAVRRQIPATVDRLGASAWKSFLEHARRSWPEAAAMAVEDAQLFCAHLAATQPTVLCQSELNRLRFRLSKQAVAVHWVRDLRVRGRFRCALQIFLRLGKGWTERSLYMSLG